MSKINDIVMIPITDLLEDIIDNRGKSCPTSNEGFPLIATNCIKHSSIYPTFENIRYVNEYTLHHWFRAKLKPNDILFVNKGTPGRVCLVPNPVTFCAAQDMIGLRVNNKKVYYKYLFAVLRSNFIQNMIQNYHVGIAIPHFKKSDLHNLLIPLRNIKIQKKIGDLYCELSDKIEINNKIISELESMAKTIYDYWFLQFEFPNEEGKPYKSSGGKMVWNEELKREIPEGWEAIRLEKWSELIKDGTHNPPERIEKGIPLLTGTMFGNTFLSYDGVTYITQENYNIIHSKYEPQEEDIVITKIGTLGNVNYLTKEDLPIAIHCNSALIRFPKVCKGMFEIQLLKSQEFKQKLVLAKGQSIQEFVSLSKLGAITLPKPLDANIIKYNNLTISTLKQLIQLRKENQQLTSLRDFLLPLLMNGQVGFKDEEK